MTEATVLDLGRSTLQIVMILILPMLGVSLVVGIVIGVFQAATQIHEQTLSFVPKLIAFFVVLAVLGPWMLQNMVSFTAQLFRSLPALTH